jgi:hypothetical protein
LKNILKNTRDGQCRLCGKHEETVSHLVAACPVLANAKYKERHNEVAKIVHWSLCQKYNINTIHQWWKHVPEAVTENSEVKILWDFSISKIKNQNQQQNPLPRDSLKKIFLPRQREGLVEKNLPS